MTRLEEVALIIFRKVNSDQDASWDTMSEEERQDALEWAQAAADAIDDDGVRARYFLDHGASYHSKVVGAGSAYHQVVIVSGYAAFFALWSTMAGGLPVWAVMTIGGLMAFSLLIYIGWTVIAMVVSEISTRRLTAALNAGPIDIEQRWGAAEAEGLRQQVKLDRLWIPALVASLLPAVVAALLLSGMAFRSVINQHATPKAAGACANIVAPR